MHPFTLDVRAMWPPHSRLARNAGRHDALAEFIAGAPT